MAVGTVTCAMWMVLEFGDGFPHCLLQPAGVWVHCPICDLMAFLVHKIRGSWLLLIHP